MSVMSYKNYRANVQFSEEDNLFIGRLSGIRDIVTFEGDNVAALRTAFEEAVEDYLETCRKIGKSPQKQYSGKVLCRVAPEIHAAVAQAAEADGVSLSKWVEKTLARATSIH